MKKYLFMAVACLSLVFSSCGDDNKESENTTAKGKVQYEASVSDPENFKIKVSYTVGVDVSSNIEDTNYLTEVIVESPFTFEQEAKYGTYLWISVSPVPKSDELENLQKPKSVEAKMYMNGKLFKTHSGENYALVQYVFGQDN